MKARDDLLGVNEVNPTQRSCNNSSYFSIPYQRNSRPTYDEAINPHASTSEMRPWKPPFATKTPYDYGIYKDLNTNIMILNVRFSSLCSYYVKEFFLIAYYELL